MYFGAYLGMGIMTVYLGRRFYWKVLRATVFISDKDGDVLPREAWAARVGVLSALLLIIILKAIGLHPILAVAFVLLCGLLFLMVARVNAATGLFIIQPLWHPVDVILGTLGVVAIGPHAIMILALLCAVITIDTRIAVLPLVLNSLKVAEDQHPKAKLGKLATWTAVAVILAMVAGTGLAVYMPYNFGLADTGGVKWGQWVAKTPPQLVEKVTGHMTESELEDVKQPLTFSRLLSAAPAKDMFLAIGIGLGLVIVASALRLRFARWPIHPVMFMVWGQPWMIVYAPSFLLAWLVKSLVMKYGGKQAYQKSRRFFVGLVLGEIAAAVVWAVVSIVFYLVTGTQGEKYVTRL